MEEEVQGQEKESAMLSPSAGLLDSGPDTQLAVGAFSRTTPNCPPPLPHVLLLKFHSFQ